MHIDLMWVFNWVTFARKARRKNYPDAFQLPSRAVRYFYNHDVQYIFGDGRRKRTLDSHRLICDECNRLFSCNLNHIPGHWNSWLGVGVEVPLFFRRADFVSFQQEGQ